VHELDAEGAAVSFAEVGKDIAEGPWPSATEGSGVEHAVEIGLAEAEGGQGEIGVLVWGDAEGVEVGEGVAEGAVGKEEIIEAGLGKNIAGGGGGGGTVAGWRAELATEFKALEEAAPDGLHRGWIGFPLLVELLEKIGVAWVPQPTEGGGRSCGGAVGV